MKVTWEENDICNMLGTKVQCGDSKERFILAWIANPNQCNDKCYALVSEVDGMVLAYKDVPTVVDVLNRDGYQPADIRAKLIYGAKKES